MRAVADARRPVQIHFTERLIRRQFRYGYCPECSHWPMRVMPAASDPDKPWGALHAPALPEGSDIGLGTAELCLCLAASPAWPCL